MTLKNRGREVAPKKGVGQLVTLKREWEKWWRLKGRGATGGA